VTGWFLRMALWVRNPPSAKRVQLVLVVVGVCLGLFALERVFGWPDWLTPNRVPGGGVQ